MKLLAPWGNRPPKLSFGCQKPKNTAVWRRFWVLQSLRAVAIAGSSAVQPEAAGLAAACLGAGIPVAPVLRW